jgi:hypothetical protein
MAYEENFTLDRFGHEFRAMLEEVIANYSAATEGVRREAPEVGAIAQEVAR